MSTLLTDCLSCKKSFKSLYSLTKHRRDRHEDDSPVIPVFKDASGNIVLLPQPRQQLDPIDQAGYKLWVAGLVERINATLHPRLPGRWVKIDSHQVPSHFEHFLFKLQVQANSIRETSHKAQPLYSRRMWRVSYKIFHPEKLYLSLQEQDLVELKSEALFAGNTLIESAGSPSQSALTAEEEIAKAKSLVYLKQGVQKPSFKSAACWIGQRSSNTGSGNNLVARAVQH